MSATAPAQFNWSFWRGNNTPMAWQFPFDLTDYTALLTFKLPDGTFETFKTGVDGEIDLGIFQDDAYPTMVVWTPDLTWTRTFPEGKVEFELELWVTVESVVQQRTYVEGFVRALGGVNTDA